MTPTEIQEVQQAIVAGMVQAVRAATPLRGDVVPPSPVSPPAVTPGYKTTEFYGHVAVCLIGLLLAGGVVQTGSGLDRILGIAAMALSQMGYSVSRGLCKMNAPKK